MAALFAHECSSICDGTSRGAPPALLSFVAWHAAKRTTGKGAKGANPHPLKIASDGIISRSHPAVAFSGGKSLFRVSPSSRQQSAPSVGRKHWHINRLTREIGDSKRHRCGVRRMSAIASPTTTSRRRAPLSVKASGAAETGGSRRAPPPKPPKPRKPPKPLWKGP